MTAGSRGAAGLWGHPSEPERYLKLITLMDDFNKHLMRLHHVLDTEISDTMLVTQYLEPTATVPAKELTV